MANSKAPPVFEANAYRLERFPPQILTRLFTSHDAFSFKKGYPGIFPFPKSPIKAKEGRPLRQPVVMRRISAPARPANDERSSHWDWGAAKSLTRLTSPAEGRARHGAAGMRCDTP